MTWRVCVWGGGYTVCERRVLLGILVCVCVCVRACVRACACARVCEGGGLYSPLSSTHASAWLPMMVC